MGTYSEFKEFYNDFKKDKIMMWLFRMIVCMFIIASAYAAINYAIGSHKGQHVRMFYGLFEDNIPNDKPQIVYKYKIDTIYLNSGQPKAKINNNKINKVDVLNQ